MIRVVLDTSVLIAGLRSTRAVRRGQRPQARADGAAALARSPHVGRLKVLNLQRNNIADDGLRAISEAPRLAELTSPNSWLTVRRFSAT